MKTHSTLLPKPMETTPHDSDSKGASNEPREVDLRDIIGHGQTDVQKRKRGRPRKDQSGIGIESSDPSLAASPSLPAQTFDIPKEAISPILQMPFKAAALKTGFDGWNLSSEEANAVAPMVDAVIKRYLPDSTNPHAALIALCGTLTVFTGIRYMAFLEWKKDQVKIQPGSSEHKALSNAHEVGHA